MSREALIVPEKREKIERIKSKYNNMQMSDDVADKIRKLEITNKVLVAATAAAGIAAAINFIIPDPIPMIDEVLLSGLTGLLHLASNIVDKKIDDLTLQGSTNINIDEVNKITEQIKNVASAINDNKQKTK